MATRERIRSVWTRDGKSLGEPSPPGSDVISMTDEIGLLALIEQCDGIELHVENHSDHFRVAEALRDAGRVRISGRRGPDKMWVRVELPT